jgi:hypothetical protein
MKCIIHISAILLLSPLSLTDLMARNVVGLSPIPDTLIIVDTLNTACEGGNLNLKIAKFNDLDFMTSLEHMRNSCADLTLKYQNNDINRVFFSELKMETGNIGQILGATENKHLVELLVSELIKKEKICVKSDVISNNQIIWESEVKTNTIYERFKLLDGTLIFELIKGYF